MYRKPVPWVVQYEGTLSWQYNTAQYVCTHQETVSRACDFDIWIKMILFQIFDASQS